jgi:formylglycine-generating enzyme required for sulfatase activity
MMIYRTKVIFILFIFFISLSAIGSANEKVTLQNEANKPKVLPQKQKSARTPVNKKYADMVLISGGEFEMGSILGDDDEEPVHKVHVDSFYIDRYEVTNRMFKKFVDANPKWRKDKIPEKYHDGDYLKHWNGNTYPPNLADHPVVYVSWYAADAYAKWRGKRLPTEAEWEMGASYNLVNNNMKKKHKFNWSFGDRFEPRRSNTAHYHGLAIGGLWQDWWKKIGLNSFKSLLNGNATTKVGTFPAGANNLYDMTGNVWEWCQDWYQEDAYKKAATLKQPKQEIAQAEKYDYLYEASSPKEAAGLETRYRVIRGGSWNDNDNIARTTNRYKFLPHFCYDDVGFRCAADAK